MAPEPGGATKYVQMCGRVGAVGDVWDAKASSIASSIGFVISSRLTSCPCSGTADAVGPAGCHIRLVVALWVRFPSLIKLLPLA